MLRAREAIATTSFVAVMDMEKGFEGREIEAMGVDGEESWWMCRVESQDAEIRM